MNDEIEIKERILAKADEKFHQFGFSKVTMEEIAADLSISKKTLYKFFSNKEQILKELLTKIKCTFEEYIEKLFKDDSIEFIEKLKNLMDFISKNSARMDGPLIQDILKNHPVLWKEIQEFRKEKANKNVTWLIQEGVKSGMFRSDIQPEIITAIFIGAIHVMTNMDTLSQLPLSAEQAHKFVSKVIMEGILSEDGRNEYKSKNVFNENNGERTL